MSDLRVGKSLGSPGNDPGMNVSSMTTSTTQVSDGRSDIAPKGAYARAKAYYTSASSALLPRVDYCIASLPGEGTHTVDLSEAQRRCNRARRWLAGNPPGQYHLQSSPEAGYIDPEYRPNWYC